MITTSNPYIISTTFVVSFIDVTIKCDFSLRFKARAILSDDAISLGCSCKRFENVRLHDVQLDLYCFGFIRKVGLGYITLMFVIIWFCWIYLIIIRYH